MSTIRIERLGGIAGFGGAHLRSAGECAMSDLSAFDRKVVEDLFVNKRTVSASNANSLLRDGFTYRISRSGTDGLETVDAPEGSVPAALIARVKDSID